MIFKGKKKNYSRSSNFFLISIPIVLIYALFAMRQLGAPPLIEKLPSLTIPEQNSSITTLTRSAGTFYPFINSSRAGYFLDSGETSLLSTLGKTIAIDAEHFLEIDTERGKGSLFSVSDGIKKEITFLGTPLLSKGRIFSIRQDLQGAGELDENGGVIWSHEFGTLITAISITASGSAWGLLDGSIKLFSVLGEPIGTINPAQLGVSSSYSCVYALAITPDATTVLALYGLDPQYIVALQRVGGIYEVQQKEALKVQTNESQEALFSNSTNFGLLQTAQGFWVYDVQRKMLAPLTQASLADADPGAVLFQCGPERIAILSQIGQNKFLTISRKGAVEVSMNIPEDIVSGFYSKPAIILTGSKTIDRYRLIL